MKKLHFLALLLVMAGDAIFSVEAMNSSLSNEAPVNQGQFQTPTNQEQSNRTTNTGIHSIVHFVKMGFLVR